MYSGGVRHALISTCADEVRALGLIIVTTASILTMLAMIVIMIVIVLLLLLLLTIILVIIMILQTSKLLLLKVMKIMIVITLIITIAIIMKVRNNYSKRCVSDAEAFVHWALPGFNGLQQAQRKKQSTQYIYIYIYIYVYCAYILNMLNSNIEHHIEHLNKCVATIVDVLKSETTIV